MFDYTSKPLRASCQDDNAGAYNVAGLPNILGTAKGVYLTYAASSSYTGAFSQESYGLDGRGVSHTGDSNGYRIVNFDANSYNKIYGNSNTVIPDSTNIPCIIYLGK